VLRAVVPYVARVSTPPRLISSSVRSRNRACQPYELPLNHYSHVIGAPFRRAHDREQQVARTPHVPAMVQVPDRQRRPPATVRSSMNSETGSTPLTDSRSRALVQDV
jgi:hypothetical protein